MHAAHPPRGNAAVDASMLLWMSSGLWEVGGGG